MLRSGGRVLVQVADGDDGCPCALRERHERSEGTGVSLSGLSLQSRGSQLSVFAKGSRYFTVLVFGSYSHCACFRSSPSTQSRVTTQGPERELRFADQARGVNAPELPFSKYATTFPMGSADRPFPWTVSLASFTASITAESSESAGKATSRGALR